MTTGAGSVVGRVAELWRFPVKSMLGERLAQAEVGGAGVVGDRHWALLDAEDGKVVSAKNPRKWGRILELRATYRDEPAEGGTWVADIALPDGTTVGTDDPDVGRVLSTFLGRDVRLEARAPTAVTMEETWPDVEGLAPEAFIEQTQIDTGVAGETVSDITIAMAAPAGTFFDLSSLHLLTTSTLRRLAELEPDGAFDVRRYRPNVLVESDGDGFVENDWVGADVAIGGATMKVAFPTMRCIMTTLAVEDLPKDPRLLQTLAAHNRLELFGGSWACAGVYGDAAAPGTVRVGDEVRLPG